MISRILHQYAYSKRMVGVWAPRGGLSLAHRALCTSSSSGTPVRIPQDAVSISFARSSGAGGQNVNKVNTKAELRFNLQDARGTWLPSDVADRLATMYDKHTTKAGEFFVSSEQHRTYVQTSAELSAMPWQAAALQQHHLLPSSPLQTRLQRQRSLAQAGAHGCMRIYPAQRAQLKARLV